MSKSVLTTLATLFLLGASTANAQIQQAGFSKPDCGEDCCVEPCCLVCCCEVKTVKEKKHCWEVECVPVCIPKVRCPLFSLFRKGAADECGDCGAEGCDSGGCDGLCGKVRMVRKLKKKEYECEKQVVEWSVCQAESGCGKCGEGCAPPSCCAPCGY